MEWNSLYSLINEPLAFVDPDTRCWTSASAEFENSLGCSCKPGQRVVDTGTASVRAALDELLTGVLDHYQKSAKVEVDLEPTQGRRMPARLYASKVKQSDVNFLRIRIQDLSEVRKQQAVLQSVSELIERNQKIEVEAKKRLEAILDEYHFEYITLGRDLQLQSDRSKGANELLGLTATSNNLFDAVPLPLAELHPVFTSWLHAGPQPGSAFVTRSLNLNNRYLELRFFPFIYQNHTRAILIAVRDLSELKKAALTTLSVEDMKARVEAIQASLALPEPGLASELVTTLSRVSEIRPFSEALGSLNSVWFQAIQAFGRQAEPIRFEGEVRGFVAPYRELFFRFADLVRNAADHGLEASEERKKAQKQELGRMVIRISETDSHYAFEFEDDGRGININSVKQSAEALGFLAPGADPKKALLAVFEKGVTVRYQGGGARQKGMGLNLVRDEVIRLRGSVGVETQAGAFTRIRIQVPKYNPLASVIGRQPQTPSQN